MVVDKTTCGDGLKVGPVRTVNVVNETVVVEAGCAVTVLWVIEVVDNVVVVGVVVDVVVVVVGVVVDVAGVGVVVVVVVGGHAPQHCTRIS